MSAAKRLTGLAGRWNLGKVRVARVVEMEMDRGNRFILPDASPEVVKSVPWLSPHFATKDGQMILSIHTFVIDTPGGQRIAVDTCIGNHKTGRGVPWWNNLKGSMLEDLEGAGYPLDSFTHVMCTHLHVDHVGFNTRLENGKWVPTFPNAKYLFVRREFDFWKQSEEEGDKAIMGDSVLPIMSAGLATLIEPNEVLVDEGFDCKISLVPTHGHTPGHVSVMISSQGHDALITGDFIHHPIQMARLEIAALTADSNVIQARNTRIRMLDSLADSSTLVMGTHFATPSVGYVKRDKAAFRFEVLADQADESGSSKSDDATKSRM